MERKRKCFREDSTNSVFKAPFKQSLMDAYSAREWTARDMLTYLLEYQKLVLRFSVTNDINFCEKKAEVA